MLFKIIWKIPYAPLNKVSVHVLVSQKTGHCERTIQSTCNVFNLQTWVSQIYVITPILLDARNVDCLIIYHTPYCQLVFLIFQNITILYINLIDTMHHRQFPLSNNNKRRPMFNIDYDMIDVQLVVHNSQYNVAWQR